MNFDQTAKKNSSSLERLGKRYLVEALTSLAFKPNPCPSASLAQALWPQKPPEGEGGLFSQWNQLFKI
jgi:hypothetical protein